MEAEKRLGSRFLPANVSHFPKPTATRCDTDVYDQTDAAAGTAPSSAFRSSTQMSGQPNSWTRKADSPLALQKRTHWTDIMFLLVLPYESSRSILGKGIFSSWQWEQEIFSQKLMYIFPNR